MALAVGPGLGLLHRLASPSRSCWPWRPTPPSAGCPSWPAWWPGTTTSPTSSAMRGDRQVFSQRHRGARRPGRACCSSRSTATPTRSSPSSPSASSSASPCRRPAWCVHWRRDRPPRWRRRAAVNGIGAGHHRRGHPGLLGHQVHRGGLGGGGGHPGLHRVPVPPHPCLLRAHRRIQLGRRDPDATAARAKQTIVIVPVNRHLAADPSHAVRGRVARPGGDRRHRGPTHRPRGHALGRCPAAGLAHLGPRRPARVLTPTTPRWSSPSCSSSTRCAPSTRSTSWSC